ncbi:ceramide synthase 6-like [Teleopsis dalmanni]|uniref:ceramide synthase 6-like n=1 Tax=Teleopsis dalmanni TaxID=139649 RepID=UPI0018CF15CC|nr:ceramide synthase 6-like [Teleopsis dalmanni]
MSILGSFGEAFWSTRIWLPPNTTWEDIAPGSRLDVKHADYRDLVWPLPLALVVMIIRFALERYWIAPVGKSLGIRNLKPKKAPFNKVLQKAFETSSKLDHQKIIELSKHTDLTKRQVERWWRLRKAQDKPSTLTKFCETTWRCIYYTYSFIFGVIVLWDKPWFWDLKNCWYGYPHQVYLYI